MNDDTVVMVTMVVMASMPVCRPVGTGRYRPNASRMKRGRGGRFGGLRKRRTVLGRIYRPT